MTSRAFWEEVRSKWIMEAPPKIEVKTGLGGEIDPKLLLDPWEMEEIPFEMVDHDKAFEAALTGKGIPLNLNAVNEYCLNGAISEKRAGKPKAACRPKLDASRFDGLMEKQTFPDYIEACKMLKACALPRNVDDLYGELIDRMKVLDDVVEQNKNKYMADVSKFHELYIPEALQVTATYVEYLNIGVENEILDETETDVVKACESLLQAVNDKIEEICRQVSLEIQAQAKALAMKIGMDGYVKPEYKIDK